MNADTRESLSYALSRMLATRGALEGAAVVASPLAKELIEAARATVDDAVEALEAALACDGEALKAA